jgi:hypothetical protein
MVPLSFVEAPWRLVMRKKFNLKFWFKWIIVNEILPRMVEKTKEMYISSSLESCNSCTVSFDLWMSAIRMDTFIMIIHFLNDQWEPFHVIVGFFGTSKFLWE